MSYATMAKELSGDIADYPYALAKTHLAEALSLIEDESLWSFQLVDSGWLTPGLLGGDTQSFLSPGTISVNPFASTLTGDATASAAWQPFIGTGINPNLTQMQIRIPYYSLYNIVSVNNDNPEAVVLTLDRPWMEPKQTNSGYLIYQAYFAAPGSGVQAADTGWAFRKFYAIRDTTNNAPINWWLYDQPRLGIKDPQRTVFDQPQYCVPYQVDTRPGSATLGQMLFELWPHPIMQLPYTFSCLAKGPGLANPTDTVPYPLTEELVKWRAKCVAYQRAEAQKGSDVQRGSGAQWLLLAGMADAEYKRLLQTAKRSDQAMVDLYFSKVRRNVLPSGPFATVEGQLNVGSLDGE